MVTKNSSTYHVHVVYVDTCVVYVPCRITDGGLLWLLRRPSHVFVCTLKSHDRTSPVSITSEQTTEVEAVLTGQFPQFDDKML